MIDCDLHNYRFKEGIEEVIMHLRICWNLKIDKIRIIHGYHGHILKDYVESSRFLKDMGEEGFLLKINTNLSKNPGVSVFRIKNLNKMFSNKNENGKIDTGIMMQKLKKLKKNKRINIQEIQF